MKSKKVLAFLFLFIVPSLTSHAYWVWSPESGKFVNPDEAKQDSAEEQYEYAMRLYREKSHDKAIDELKDLLKKYRTSKIAPEAEYRLGIIYEEKSDYEKAFDAYKTIVESYPQSERIPEVIEREFKIGNLFLSGQKGKLMGLEILPALPRAAEIFEHIVKQAPFSEFGPEAQFRLGLTYKKMGRFEDAVTAFQAVIDNYPKSDLVSDARYQVAESAFDKSNVEKRDERALDKASAAVEHFLVRYPDSETSEKASKLRQEIDEKNAEKNYRIAIYYEKTNYLASAIIYYKDVAKRYPETKWGVKAKEKLQALEQPVSYLGNQEDQINSQIELKKAKLETIDKKKDSIEYDTLEREIDRLKQRQKTLEKNKEESLKSREEDLDRRRGELKEKEKKLEKKKELLKTNDSEDFRNALEKWQASLDEEKEDLQKEREQLAEWKRQLGMNREGFLSRLPFMGDEPLPLDEVRRIEAKNMYKVSDEKKSLLEEKEILYKQYQEVSELLSQSQGTRSDLTQDKASFTGILARGEEHLVEKEEDLEREREEIRRLEEEIADKTRQYKEAYGENLWQSFFVDIPKEVISRSAGAVGKSIDFLNPFSASGDGSTKEKSLQELAELQMHLREKIAAQEALTQTLSASFDEELAMQEQQKLMEALANSKETDTRQLRRDIKQVEKEIRKAYEDITDRHEKIMSLSKELDQVLTQRESEQNVLTRAGSAAAAPARLVMRATHDFFLGRPQKEVKLSAEAESIPLDGELSSKAKEIKDAIQLEGVMIESRNKEIYNLRKELDILKSHASLAGGYKFRSAIVSVPYEFMEDALHSARSIVPTKDRKEMLVSHLDEEAKRLEEFRKQLVEVDKRLAAVSESSSEESEKKSTGENKDVSRETLSPSVQAEEELLRTEIQDLKAKLQSAAQAYERKQKMIEKEKDAIEHEAGQKKEQKKWDAQVKDISGREEHLQKELKKLGEELSHLIEKEGRLESKEVEILEKRINKIDQLVKSTSSKATAQDLLTERGRMEDRLSQIELRKDFLSKEMKRF